MITMYTEYIYIYVPKIMANHRLFRASDAGSPDDKVRSWRSKKVHEVRSTVRPVNDCCMIRYDDINDVG